MAKLMIKIAKNGTTDLTALGIQGNACAPIVRKFQLAMGGEVISDQATHEMFEQDLAQHQVMLEGGGVANANETGLS